MDLTFGELLILKTTLECSIDRDKRYGEKTDSEVFSVLDKVKKKLNKYTF